MKSFRILSGISILLICTCGAYASILSSFKDELFAYPKVLSTHDDGRRITVDYQSSRDINQRDQIPERRVHGRYIDLSVRRFQKQAIVKTPRGSIPHVRVGNPDHARFIVLYLHGQGGNKNQGMNDYTFGGNFNRIKNLSYKNGGLYLTMDFSDFGSRGEREVAGLLDVYSNRSPKARIYLACGSMGGALCWRIADNAEIVSRLGGILLLGSHWDENFMSSHAFRRNVPVFFGHGSADTVFPIQRQEAFFRRILAKKPRYPARFVRFETGSHGTPIRMVNWRDTLNWMANF